MKKVTSLLLFLTGLSLPSVTVEDSVLTGLDVTDICEAFGIPGALILDKRARLWNTVRLCRVLMKHDKACSHWPSVTPESVANLKYYGVILLDTVMSLPDQFYSAVGTSYPMVVMSNSTPAAAKFSIGQLVYFFDRTTYKVEERYTINGQDVRNIVGTFRKTNSRLKWRGQVRSWDTRRSNFQGIKLKAMTEVEPPSVFIDPDFRQKSRAVLGNNDTFDITGLVSGTYYDAWEMLGHQFNFSTTYYKR